MACEMCLSEIEGNGFVHDGDSFLGRHVTNARRRPNRWGISIGKEAPKSSRKIDAAVAMILARHARRLVLSSKTFKEQKEQAVKAGKRSIWSFS
jgi:phage terminase large subunit-like protein